MQQSRRLTSGPRAGVSVKSITNAHINALLLVLCSNCKVGLQLQAFYRATIEEWDGVCRRASRSGFRSAVIRPFGGMACRRPAAW